MPDSHEITRPYPGLRPFESWEGEIFFGREEHTNRLLDILKERHFLAVIGPSGSGKSSLVRAGLLPALPLGSLGTGSDWRIALMRPGNRPIRSLAHALLARSTLGIELVGKDRIPHNERDMTPDVALIETDLRRGPLGLIDIVRDARTRQTDDETFNLLILVDQFEELFTYADAGGQQADEAEAFINLLLACQTMPAARIYIVLTMRTDFLGNCVRFLNLPDAINKAQYLTPRLTREQIERAITSPAYLFDGDVEPTLVTELINTASNDQDQLPILQHALCRMWDEADKRQHKAARLAWNDFNTVGGISNALSQHADELLATLSPRHKIEQPLCPEQQAAMDLFRAITEQRSAEAGGQAVRRPQSLARIAKWSGRTWQDFIPVIMAYTKEGVNFLHINEPLNSETIVDISHEALIRQWQRLRHWVIQETRLASEYQRFRERAEAFRNESGSLLTGADLARALEWRDGAYSRGNGNDLWRPNAQWADRYRKNKKVSSEIEFNAVLKFIDDSHAVVRAAKKRARIVKRTLITLTIFSVITTIGSFGFAYQSHTNQIMAEAALLWTPLDFGLPGFRVTEEQARGLVKLETASDAQQWTFFDQLLKDHALAERFSNNPSVITTALVGISPDRKNKLLDRLYKAPPDHSDIARLTRFLIFSELEVPVASDAILSVLAIKDNKALPARKLLGQRIKTLIDKMPEHDLDILASQLLASLNNPLADYESAPRSEALAAIIIRMPQEKLGNMADQLMTVIKITNDPLQFDMLKESLAQLTLKMQDEHSSGALANQLLSAIKSASAREQKAAFAKGLENLAAKLPTTEAETIAGQLALLIKEADDTYPFQTLGQSLATLTVKISEQNAKAALLANQLMTHLKLSTLPEQFDALGQGLAAIASKLQTSEREALAGQLIEAIKAPGQFKIIDTGSHDNDQERFLTLGQILAEMVKRTPPERAETWALALFSDLMKPLEREQLYALSQGLAASAAGMTQAQADIYAERIMTAMKNTQNGGQFGALGEGLAGLAKQISPHKAQDLAQQLIALINKQEKKQYFARFDALGKGLSETAGKVSERQADALTGQLITAISTSDNRMQILAFGSGAAKVAANIPTAQIAPKMTLLLSLLTESDDAQLKALVKILEAMARNLSEDQALVIAEQLIAAIADLPDNPKDELERIRSKTFGKGLKAISAKVQGIQAKTLAGWLIVAINAAKATGKQEALGQGLAAACANVTQDSVADLASQLVKSMKDSASPAQFAALGKGLSNAVEKLPETQKTLAKQLVGIILQTQNAAQLDSLGQTLNVITGTPEPENETIVDWFELLKNPLTPRPILAAAIRQRIADIPKENQGFWNLIQWAKQHFPQIDLENPPKDLVNL